MKKLLSQLLLLLLFTIAISCSSNDDQIEEKDNNEKNEQLESPSQDGESGEEKETIYTNLEDFLKPTWNHTLDEVKLMLKGEYVLCEENSYISCRFSNFGQTVSYDFYKGKLCAIMFVIPQKDINEVELERCLVEYKQLGEIDDYPILINQQYNALATFQVLTDTGELAIGLTQLDLNEYTDLFIPYNELWYTTIDENVVKPYKTKGLSAHIVKNYYENGKGVMLFDGDLTRVGELFLNESYNLKTIILPESVVEIGNGAFQCCHNLEKAIFNNSDRYVMFGSHLFYDDEKLHTVQLPDRNRVIEESTFSGCKSIKSIFLPKELDYIELFAFSRCSSLSSIYINSQDPPTLDMDVFYKGPSYCKVYVPTNSVDRYKYDEDWLKYSDWIVGYNFDE